ncbi:MAG: D-alanine--D-alanine ligase [Microbacteriaceae bacterium]|nr:D-alanine--D-alanine ligase [Microbacteriaceae bacterium]
MTSSTLNKTIVGIIFGGANSEHEVSCASASGVFANLDRERFEPVLIRISRDGLWQRVESIDDPATGGELLPDLSGLDIVLPVLHGRFGEDGTVQGLFELVGVPYVGCGVLSSALAMDKLMTQRVLSAAGLPTIPTRGVSDRTRHTASAVADELGYPVFVKPNRAGSSVGASRVDSPAELDAALDLALASDSLALLQPVVDAEEIDLGVLQEIDGELSIGAPLHILSDDGRAFFDYASKYTAGGHEFEVPARLSDELRTTLESFAITAFRALDCEGLARVDFFLSTDGTVAINEVNTLPGMTALSQYPTIWEATGVGYRELITRLIDRGLAARSAGSRPAGSRSTDARPAQAR